MEPLFNKIGVFSVMEHRKAELKAAVQRLPADALTEDAEQIALRIAKDFSVDIPTIDVSGIYATEEQVQLDARYLPDRNRFILDSSRPVYVGGTRITVHVPFIGDHSWFDVQPSSYTNNPPVGAVHDAEIHLTYEVADANFSITADYERAIGEIQRYLSWLRESAEQSNQELHEVARAAVAKRKQDADAHSKIVGSLGIPVRKVAAVTAASAPSVGTVRSGPVRGRPRSSSKPKNRDLPPSTPKEEGWDVFVSHASEDKEQFARPLAEALRAKGLKVWFDEFTLKLGDSLRQSIDKGLSRSRFGVVILSPNFFQRHWTTQELNGLATREVDGKKVILPVWHNVSFDDVRKYSPTLADKFAIKSDEGLDKVVESILGEVT